MSNKLTKLQIKTRQYYNITERVEKRKVILTNFDKYLKDNIDKTYIEIEKETGVTKTVAVRYKKEYGFLKTEYKQKDDFDIELSLPYPLDRYLITSNSEVIVKDTRQVLRPKIVKDGYYTYTLFGSDKKRYYKRQHRLYALHFIPNPLNKCCINHRDGEKLNGYNSNLEWSTLSENSLHYHNVLGSKDHGENSNWAKITEKQAKEIIRLLNQGYSQASVVRELDFATRAIVQGIKLNKAWKHLKR